MKQPNSAAEEMGPVEEVIKAFLDYLVDPLLPLRTPPGPPLLSNQQKVAKQMHAVVLLYNYYQRKRHAHAEYIDFMSFCKLVVTLKPVLAAYMTSMQGSVPTDSENLENQFSVTEKAIEDACKISMSLDASRDIPDVKEWEVSKIAVFLVNSSKENCALSFNSLTDGVWSIFEKNIDHCVDNQDKSKDPNKKKRKRRQPTGESDLQQLAFSALKEARGIQQSHLTILERHVTYSLDKERTAACCFIMECRSTNQKFEFSVRDTIESLQGPLVEKSYGNWTLTQLIEYYNVLPYAGIMSSWFSRQFPLISSELLNVSILENIPEYGKPDSKSVDFTLSELVDVERQSAENCLKDMDNIISYDCANAIVREDACGESYIRAQRKGDSTDVESDKTYDDDNLAGSKSNESRVDYDNGPESKNGEGMDVDLGGTLSGSEILPQKSKEESIDVESDKTNDDDNNAKNKIRVDYDNEQESENVEGMDVDLGGTSSGAENLPQKSKEESTDVESDKTYDNDNLAKSNSIVSRVGFDNGPESENGEGMDMDLSGVLLGAEILPQNTKEESTNVEPDETYDDDNLSKSKSTECRVEDDNGQESENVEGMDVDLSGRLPGSEILPQRSKKESMSVNVIESNKGVRPFDKEANVQSPCENPDDNVKIVLQSSKWRVPEKTCTSLQVLQQKSSGLHVDDIQEASSTLTNEVNSTIISLLGDANSESKLKSDERLAKEKDLKLCRSESQCEGNSGLLCIYEENILEKGNLRNELNEKKATIASQTDDTDDVRSDKPDLKLIARKDLEHGTTDMKPDPGLAPKPPSKCGTIDSSLQKDISMPIRRIPSFPLGKGSNDSPLTCPKGKDQILSTKSVIVNNANRKRSRNPEACATTECENTEGTSVADPPIIPAESVNSAVDNLLSVLALRETELSEAALGFLLHKKNELYHQLQEIQEQITLCDQRIQKISDAPGNKDSLVLKVDTMINCCFDFLKTGTEVQCNSYNEAGGHGAIQLPRPETTFKPFVSIGSTRQESDNSNTNICAPADQFMPSSNGNFLSRVCAGEMDFKCTGEGGRFSSPPEMESVAAAEIIAAGERMVEPEPENH